MYGLVLTAFELELVFARLSLLYALVLAQGDFSGISQLATFRNSSTLYYMEIFRLLSPYENALFSPPLGVT